MEKPLLLNQSASEDSSSATSSKPNDNSTESSAYFSILKEGLNKAYEIATIARKKGFDPVKEVEVKIAKDIAARVEGIVGPPGIATLIRSLEKKGMDRENIAFEIARKIASGEVISGDKEQLIEQAVRSGLGILTEGVLVAPTEGIAKVRIKTNPDGTNFVAVYYSGPIRSAGGTAVALSLVLADIARKICGIGDYRPTDTQIMRYNEEIHVYENRCVHLQYLPSEDDIKVIVSNCPICVDGEPTEEVEVSAYRDVPGIETNRVRGGVPLVICDGIALKASKLFKYTKKLKLNWDFLEKIIKVKKKEDKIEIKPDPTYLEGLVAGRPVFCHASAKGGFRLRYGKSRTNGLMAKNIHPAAMILLDEFPAYGTHFKIERPGKGCVISANEDLEPPVVKLKSGRVLKVNTLEEAYALKNELKEVLFLGDLLCTFGDFLKSNHVLLPSGYCKEWWEEEIKASGLSIHNFENAFDAFIFAKTHSLPVHPDYTYFWHDIDVSQLGLLAESLKTAKVDFENNLIRQLQIKNEPKIKKTLEDLLIPHRIVDEYIALASDEAYSLICPLGATIQHAPEGPAITFSAFDAIFSNQKDSNSVLQIISNFYILRAKAPTYIGARMGRPEKAKERKMDGSPHVLFPTGSFKNRSLTKQCRLLLNSEKERTINLELVRLRCQGCKQVTFLPNCHICGADAIEEKICQKCGSITKFDTHCEMKTVSYDRRPIDLLSVYDKAKELLNAEVEDLKGVKGLSNPSRVPERLEKGFLRAKHDVYVFRDGTSRFDATDVPLTHFKPNEIGLSLAKLKELGYEKDYLGNKIVNGEQLVPLKHQDILISENGAEYFVRLTNFIDDLLMNVYQMPSFYNVETKEDLIGHLGVGLSPHTSAGALCRIIGFTKAFVGYAHPYFHTVKRRNCFSGNESLLVHDGKSYKLMQIKDLVEQNLVNKKSDDFGTVYSSVSNLKIYSYNRITKKFELADITHVSKHLSPTKLLKIRTKSGRVITVTPDHPFANRKGEKIKAEEANEILIPWNIDTSKVSYQEKIDLLSTSQNPNIMIRAEEDLFDFDQPLSEVSKNLNLSYKTPTNYRYRKSYPLKLINKLNPTILSNSAYRLGSKRDKVSVKPSIDINEDFMELVGFYIAEGYIKKNQKDTNQISITATKKWAKNYLVKKIKNIFDLHPSVSENVVTICSSFVLELFKNLKLDRNAHTKSIPDFIFSLPKEKQIAFLRGYFSGDGSCSLGSTLETNLTSVNKSLIDGVSYLLMFLGIKHSISEENRFITSGTVYNFYGKPKALHSYKIRIFGEAAQKFIETVGFVDEKHHNALNLLSKYLTRKGTSRTIFDGDVFVDQIIEKTYVDADEKYVYNITIAPHHTLICSGIVTYQCDGDEDCIMLLMDALLNFSRKYLDEKRGGTMDAPLVLSIEVNPKEVDDEAHNIEYVSHYPLEFYQIAEKFASPGEVKLKTVKDVLGTEAQFDLPITNIGGTLDIGVTRTRYVQLDSIPDKINTQFSLQDRLRAVDKKDAAERLILSHFIPDLYGNLRSYSRQTFRCVGCNDIYRRPPLRGKCTKCGGNLLLTINKGGIEKYLEIASDIVKKYDLPLYLKQRLELVDKEIKSIFEDDKIKQLGLKDFL